jgi:hypothetical protein
MAGPEVTVLFENTEIRYANFSGTPDQFNPQGGKRTFLVPLTDQMAATLAGDGWNVKQTNPTPEQIAEGAVAMPFIKVSVGFNFKPPTIFMITTKGRVPITEKNIHVLDSVDITFVDLIIRNHDYPASGVVPAGRKAWVKTMFVHINEDPLMLKYGFGGEVDDRPEGLPEGIPG